MRPSAKPSPSQLQIRRQRSPHTPRWRAARPSADPNSRQAIGESFSKRRGEHCRCHHITDRPRPPPCACARRACRNRYPGRRVRRKSARVPAYAGISSRRDMMRTAGNRDAWQSGHAHSSHANSWHSSRTCRDRAHTHTGVCHRSDLRQIDKTGLPAQGNIGAGTLFFTQKLSFLRKREPSRRASARQRPHATERCSECARKHEILQLAQGFSQPRTRLHWVPAGVYAPAALCADRRRGDDTLFSMFRVRPVECARCNSIGIRSGASVRAGSSRIEGDPISCP